MKVKQWADDHIVFIVIAVLAALVLIFALIFIWVYMQFQYCSCHPDEEWCQMKNATAMLFSWRIE